MNANEKAAGCSTTATAQNQTLPRKFSARSTATEAQIERLLMMLRLRPRHTHELRRDGISHPAGRVLDLVKRGYQIASDRVSTVDSDGFTHTGVALYSLIGEPDGERPQ